MGIKVYQICFLVTTNYLGIIVFIKILPGISSGSFLANIKASISAFCFSTAFCSEGLKNAEEKEEEEEEKKEVLPSPALINERLLRKKKVSA